MINNLIDPNSFIRIILFIASLNLIIPLTIKNQIRARNVLIIGVCAIFLLGVLIADLSYDKLWAFNFYFNGVDIFPIILNLEPLGLIFLNLLAALWLPTVIYTIGYLKINNIDHQPRFLFFLNLCVIIGILVALSGNLFTLLIFYELLTISTIPLITHQGGDEVDAGVSKYLKILLSTSMLLFLPAVVMVYIKLGHGNFIHPGVIKQAINYNQGIITRSFTDNEARILFLAFIFGISKTAVYPLGGWLPAAMVASYPVSALLHSVVVVKAGLFCLFKIMIYIFGLEYLHELFSVNCLLLIPIITIFHSALSAIKTNKIKEVLAYSTINQLSISLLAAFLFTPKGMIAAVCHMIAHAFAKISLFFAAGNIYSLKKTHYISELRGVSKIMPLTSLIISIAILSLIGIPPLAGFISKFKILQATHHQSLLVVAIIVISSLLSAIYLSKIFTIFYSPVVNNNINNDKKLLHTGMLISTVLSCSGIILFIFIQYLITSHMPILK